MKSQILTNYHRTSTDKLYLNRIVADHSVHFRLQGLDFTYCTVQGDQIKRELVITELI